MPLFVGETVRVKTSAKDYDERALTDEEVTAAKISIYDSDNTVVVDDADMAYDATSLFWYYDWDTTSADPGAYRAKCTLTGIAFTSWEYATIRLRADLV
jgi:hypothetical protein